MKNLLKSRAGNIIMIFPNIPKSVLSIGNADLQWPTSEFFRYNQELTVKTKFICETIDYPTKTSRPLTPEQLIHRRAVIEKSVNLHIELIDNLTNQLIIDLSKRR